MGGKWDDVLFILFFVVGLILVIIGLIVFGLNDGVDLFLVYELLRIEDGEFKFGEFCEDEFFLEYK